MSATGCDAAFVDVGHSSPWSRAAWQALLALGADRIPHTRGSLAAHLQGTARLLGRWGNRDALCLAGLYHAVYGTAGFEPALSSVTGRSRIAAIIGAEAEAIVYLYGACDRGVFHPRIGGAERLRFADRFARSEYSITEAQLRDFCELTLANEIELASASASLRTKRRTALAELFDPMRDWVTAPAFAAYRRVLAP